jgi:O-methyltransferase involved in polyketide biosynthesis
MKKETGTNEVSNQNLDGVAETLLIPLYHRAVESQRPDAIMRDEKAAALVKQMNYDFSKVRKIRTTEGNIVARLMLTREIDRYARDFLSRHPEGIVVHIGCGLDSRFERVDNGKVAWYDLDLPEVIDLRRMFIGGEKGRYHLLGCSVLEDSWLDALKQHCQHPFLFLADNVFIYFSEEEVRSLVLKLRDHFPGAELVFDGWSPFFIWLGNRQLSRTKFKNLLRWGFWRSQEIEGWGEGIHLLGEWGFFDQSEPRMAPYRWATPLFHIFKPMRIFHFQLGKATG